MRSVQCGLAAADWTSRETKAVRAHRSSLSPRACVQTGVSDAVDVTLLQRYSLYRSYKPGNPTDCQCLDLTYSYLHTLRLHVRSTICIAYHPSFIPTSPPVRPAPSY